jgi:hypothetical protein
MRIKLSVFLAAVSVAAFTLNVFAAEWERGISLEQALKAADIAVGFPKGRPAEYDVVTAKLVHSRLFRVSSEGLSEALKDMESRPGPKEFWLIVYRRWPPRLDNDLVVFLDSTSGKTIRVYRQR